MSHPLHCTFTISFHAEADYSALYSWRRYQHTLIPSDLCIIHLAPCGSIHSTDPWGEHHAAPIVLFTFAKNCTVILSTSYLSVILSSPALLWRYMKKHKLCYTPKQLTTKATFNNILHTIHPSTVRKP